MWLLGTHNTSIEQRILAITLRSNLSEDGTILREISYDHNKSNVLRSFILCSVSILCGVNSLGMIFLLINATILIIIFLFLNILT